MKKIIFSIFILLASIGLVYTNSVVAVEAKTVVKKHVVKKKVGHTITSMKWAPGALNAVGSLRSFDYNYSFRNSFIKKIEAAARKKHLKTVTVKFVNAFQG